MSYSGPPGVSSPHPSLPARPPPATAGSAASSAYASPVSATTPTTTYGPTVPPPSQQQQQPRLGYSRTFSSAGATGAAGASGYGSSSYNTGSSYNAYSSYAQQPQAPQAQPSYGPQAPSYGPQSYGPQVPASSVAGSTATYGPQYGPTAAVAAAAPVIRNPFPVHGTAASGGAGSSGYGQTATTYGASWPSGYGPNSNAGAPTGAAAASAGGYGSTSSAYYGQQAAAAAGAGGYYAGAAATPYGADGTAKAAGEGGDQKQQQKDRHSTVYRSGGGKTWTDDTLLEWDPSHLRLFVGNLAGEVTDETLLKAFSRWKSVQKAVVKRDKWTKKSRGYGFVSFSDADDFFQAAKEMNGKYIGSHPVVVRKSKTEIKVSDYKDDQAKKGKKGKNGAGSGADGSGGGSGKNKNSGSGRGDGGRKDPYEPALGPVSSAVHKHGKTKNGLKLLG